MEDNQEGRDLLLGTGGIMQMDKREFCFLCLRRMTTKNTDLKLPKFRMDEVIA